jgi:hypothetical protein
MSSEISETSLSDKMQCRLSAERMITTNTLQNFAHSFLISLVDQPDEQR